MDDCTCIEQVQEEHVCPYSLNIYGDDEDMCNCCESCTGTCAENV